MSEIQHESNVFLETLEWICGKLELLHIPYMITGGAALGFWGLIRTTMDIDILAPISGEQVESLVNAIQGEAYVDIAEAKRATESHSMFNIILHRTSFKVDIIPLDASNAYESEKFHNRIKMRVHDREIFVIRSEDLIISKLLWSKSSGGSERQLEDCRSIYQLNHESIDFDYVTKWVKRLGLESDFNGLV